MNKIILRGNLSRDVELRVTQKGTNVARFNVAVRRDFKNDADVYECDFINCVAYNKLAETINKYFHKGSGIIVIGHIQTGSYDDKDGKKVYTTDVVVEGIEFDRNGSEKKQEQPKEEPIKKDEPEEDPFEKFGQQLELNTNESYPWD